MASTSDLRFEWVTDVSRFLELRDSWNELGASSIETVFLTHDWLSTWLDELAPSARLHVLTAWRSERLVGAFPLSADPEDGRGRRWSLMGIGTLTPNHLDVIAHPDSLESVRAGFAAMLFEARPDWDVLDLNKLPADAGTVEAFAAAFAQSGLATSCSVSAICPFCILPATPDEYIAQRKKSIRKQIRQATRWLAEKPGSRKLVLADSEAAALNSLGHLVRFHQARWKGKGYPGAFADPRVVRFHERMVRSAQAAGSLRIYSLIDDGETIAVSYNYRVGSTVQGYLSSFDAAYADASPGLTLRVAVMSESIFEGAARFDLLEGTETYKASWCSGQRENLRLSVFNRTIAGTGAQLKLAAEQATVHLARNIVPEGLRANVVKTLAGRKAPGQEHDNES